MINLFFLKTFVDVAKTGSLQQAAHKNFVTQPAVSQHLKQLEEKLKCQLFERRSKKVFLTLSGRTFLSYAEGILKQYEEAKMRVGEINDRFCCTIRIATIYSIGLYELQPIVRSFLKKYPKMDIHLEYQPFHKIYDMVHARLIDFGFVAYPKKKHGIIAETFAEEKMVLAQSPEQRVFEKKRVSLSELNHAKFIAFASNTPTRVSVDTFFRTHNIYPKIVNEYDNIETLKSAMTLGIGCSIVPQNALAEELHRKTLEIVPVEGLELKRSLGILYPTEKPFSKSIQEFHDLVVKKPK